MQLNAREAATLLGVDEDTVYKWAEKDGLPHQVFSQQYLFHKVDLLEWAHQRGHVLRDSPGLREGEMPSLFSALRDGGVHHRVPGATKRDVLAQSVERLNLPEETDREMLVEMLLAREDQGSTGLGDGIAIPHVRNPIILHVDSPSITLCLLENPLEFGAVDGKPVFALFTMVTPTAPIHLHMLSRLAYSLRQSEFATAVRERRSADEILGQLAAVESRLREGKSGK